MNYFHLPEVSNSELTALKRAFYDLEDCLAELEDIFDFGSLVDALLTEEWRVDLFRGRLTKEDGKVVQYTEEIFQKAVRLADNLKQDPVIARLLDTMVGQYVFRRTLTFVYEGTTYTIRARCKFDGFTKRYAIGAEYKTTAAATDKAFREAVEFFDWDRAAAWYMDLARIDYFWIIGISKKNGKVFKFAVRRGDETYQRGLAKYSVWAYRWLLLVENFKLPSNEIYSIC